MHGVVVIVCITAFKTVDRVPRLQLGTAYGGRLAHVLRRKRASLKMADTASFEICGRSKHLI